MIESIRNASFRSATILNVAAGWRMNTRQLRSSFLAHGSVQRMAVRVEIVASRDDVAVQRTLACAIEQRQRIGFAARSPGIFRRRTSPAPPASGRGAAVGCGHRIRAALAARGAAAVNIGAL